MRLLITGSKGFVGKNLIAELSNKRYEGMYEIFEFDVDTDIKLLDEYTKSCDFVIHLAGINRPQNIAEYMEGNFGFTSTLLDKLKENNNSSPILVTSSIQAALNNPYGLSKKAGEDLIFNYGKEKNIKVLVYRMPNVFGKWCRPNYNSVIATFCNNVANDLPIQVNDRNIKMNLIYIDDVVKEVMNAINGKETKINENEFCYVRPVYELTLGEIVDLINSFKESRTKLSIPNMNNEFSKKLYATYLSYLPTNKFNYELKMNCDNRGSFTEMIRTQGQGQVSVNISKPGITKGNHWHHTKNEKFLVVTGHGIIRFRKVGEKEIYEYYVSSEKLEVVDIPCGYTHSITNLGDTDMVTLMWANESFDPENPDTIFLEV